MKERFSKYTVDQAVQEESRRFQVAYAWLEEHMPPSFFEEFDGEHLILIAHSLMSFHLQEHFAQIHLKNSAIALCPDGADADLRILKQYRMVGIHSYRAFVSNAPPPGITSRLRIASLSLAEFTEPKELSTSLREQGEAEIFQALHARNPAIDSLVFDRLIREMDPRFMQFMTRERFIICLDMFHRAKTRDQCQYEVRYNEDWMQKKDAPSMQLILAWRHVPKHNFLYRMAKVIYRHGLQVTRMHVSYIHPYSTQSVMLLSMGLHGSKGKAAWEEADIPDFLQELVTIKYFEGMESLESQFVDTHMISGNMGNLLKTMVHFVHQVLVHADVNMYALPYIEEAFGRHPELVQQLCQAFVWRFHPERHNLQEFERVQAHFFRLVDQVDTGNELNDTRRKNILRQAMNFIRYTLKTNFYRNNKTGFSFRLDPVYLDDVPYQRADKFPELPFAIFFIKGMQFSGFHIRFRDLARGGLRTVCPERMEQYYVERNNIFTECYALAYTQQKKNKDIPEGGAKGIILMEPYERRMVEGQIYEKELIHAGVLRAQIDEKIEGFHKEHKLEFLYQSQRAYIECLMTLINCHADGALKGKHVVDYYKKPEYIYLGPDENAHNVIIEWISEYSQAVGYASGSAFISSKPSAGINHKEFGVTSLGVHVYLEETLKFLRIDPLVESFTIKMTGGPDGDVAGNELLNLYRSYPQTARLLALTDVSGTIYDPAGLDLSVTADLFHKALSINHYPVEHLHEGGFLLDVWQKREQTPYSQQTLFRKKEGGRILEEWLNGNEMNHLWRHNILRVKTDVFIPAGGRPRTLSDTSWKDFLDDTGKPTARAIIEGANLFLTPWARRSLEKLGLIIMKDSSANKGGVICSSLEVLSGLVMSEEDFLMHKSVLVKEFLEVIRQRSRDEAQLLLHTYQSTGEFLTDLSELISERINTYMYQLLDYLQTIPLGTNTNDPFVRCLLQYCPPFLRNNYEKNILTKLPDLHKKAIIACYIAQKLVYTRGLSWSPTLVDVLPLVVQDPAIFC